MKQISERIFIGDSSDVESEDLLSFSDIQAVLNVASDLELPPYDYVIKRNAGLIAGGGNKVADIEKVVAEGERLLKVHTKLLVCCHSGKDRSPLATAAIMAVLNSSSFERELSKVIEKNNGIAFASEDSESDLMDVFSFWDNQRRLSNSKISIIVPCYKNTSVVKLCLDSIRSSTKYSPYEIIAVDDSSNDPHLSKILNGLCDTVIENNFNLGSVKSRNIGAENSTGEIICQIDSDCLFFPNWAINLHQSLFFDSYIAISAPIFTFNSLFLGKQMLNNRSESDLLYVDKVSSACMMYRRDLHEKIGFFDDNLEYGEDKEFCERLKSYNYLGGHSSIDFVRNKIVVNLSTVVYHHGECDETDGFLKRKERNSPLRDNEIDSKVI